MTESAGLETSVLPPRPQSRSQTVIVINVLLAASITLHTVYATLGAGGGTHIRTTVLVWPVALALGLPLMFRRRWPIPVLGVVLVSAIISVLLGMSAAAAVLAVAVALYPVALLARPQYSIVALGIALLGITSSVLVVRVLSPPFLVVEASSDSFDSDLLPTLANSWFIISGAWALGRSFRARGEYAIQLAEYRAQRAVADERLRIAREMHDVVGHSMSVIVMKAGVANHVYDTCPEESREALQIIESVGRGALADIQRVLASLRPEEASELEPTPLLDELPKLIDNARLADVEVELVGGPLPALPSAVQLTAYRIVQEALTNVIKHVVKPARCTVRITAESGELRLAVLNDGKKPRHPAGPTGHGLIGMRERAALHHGTLVAGWQPDGGFAVLARLPYSNDTPHDLRRA